MIDLIQRFLGLGDYARDFGATRSSQWPRVRAAHLLKEPVCQVTGATNDLEAHHILPFHTHPELELDPDNLITLTRNWRGVDVHLLYGHFRNFSTKWNPNIKQEALLWRRRYEAASQEQTA